MSTTTTTANAMVVEILWAPATKAFSANPRDLPLVTPTFEALRKADGLIRSWYGTKHEDRALAYIAVAWEALGYHHNFMTDPDGYPPLVDAIGALLDVSRLSAYHVAPHCGRDAERALGAPATAIMDVTLREGGDRAALEDAVAELVRALNALPAEDGLVAAAWGPAIERDGVLNVLLGWRDVQAHLAVVTTNDAIVARTDALRAVAAVEVLHVPFAPYC